LPAARHSNRVCWTHAPTPSRRTWSVKAGCRTHAPTPSRRTWSVKAGCRNPGIPTSAMQAASRRTRRVVNHTRVSRFTQKHGPANGLIRLTLRQNLHGPPALWFNRADDDPIPELQAAHRGSDPHPTTRPMPDTRLSSGGPHGTKATWPLVPCELCGSTVGSRSRQRA
jgi:hypothetical protein